MSNKKKSRSWRKRLRPLRHSLVFGLVLAGRELLRIYPTDVAVRLGAVLGRLSYWLRPKERRLALEHLQLAFGNEKTAAERRRIVREMFANVGRSVAEMVTLERWSRDDLLQRIRCAEPDKFDRLRQGRGVIIVSAHLGNWELMSVFTALGLQQPVDIVIRDMTNPHLGRMFRRSRETMGLNVLERGKTGREFFRTLRRDRLMGILLDQDTKHGPGLFVDFFGRPAFTQLGPYQLAARSKATVATTFIVREPDGIHHRLLIGDELPPLEGESEEARARHFVQAATARIEEIIRQYPEQWLWFHQRWKRRPLTVAPDEQPVAPKAKKPRLKGDPFVSA